jgi:hypothetical protein
MRWRLMPNEELKIPHQRFRRENVPTEYTALFTVEHVRGTNQCECCGRMITGRKKWQVSYKGAKVYVAKSKKLVNEFIRECYVVHLEELKKRRKQVT